MSNNIRINDNRHDSWLPIRARSYERRPIALHLNSEEIKKEFSEQIEELQNFSESSCCSLDG